MTDPTTACPWCSAALPAEAVDRCPGCGAMLVAVPDATGDIKGVTTLDTEAILRARSEVSRPRGNRLLSFISGEVTQPPPPVNPESVAPPDVAVRREMLRLRIEAETADLEAEAVALKADELARRGIHMSELGGATPDSEPAAAPDSAGALEGSGPAELTPDHDPDRPAGG